MQLTDTLKTLQTMYPDDMDCFIDIENDVVRNACISLLSALQATEVLVKFEIVEDLIDAED